MRIRNKLDAVSTEDVVNNNAKNPTMSGDSHKAVNLYIRHYVQYLDDRNLRKGIYSSIIIIIIINHQFYIYFH